MPDNHLVPFVLVLKTRTEVHDGVGTLARAQVVVQVSYLYGAPDG